jgi:hypothetical protein
MTELVACGALVTVSAISSHAFHSWLKLRERERLSGTDKSELLKRFELFGDYKDWAGWRGKIESAYVNGKLR